MGEKNDKLNRYEDIIHLPHHVSANHPHMSLYDRAAQFAPFKALTGYEDDVAETARLTDTRIELDDSRKAVLDARLQMIEDQISSSPEVTITYFVPDARKQGGAYRDIHGRIRKIDKVERLVVFASGERVRIDDIYDLHGVLFGGGYLL